MIFNSIFSLYYECSGEVSKSLLKLLLINIISVTTVIFCRKDGADATVWRRYTSQIIAVIAKNSVLFVYGSCLGMPALIIPSLSGHDPNETIILDEEGISWIGWYFWFSQSSKFCVY